MGEIILIAVVALLVLGPDRLPSAAKALGKGIRDLRNQTKDLQQTIEKDTELGDAVRELRGALRGDPETLYERATGQRFSELTGSSSKPTIGSRASESESEGDEGGQSLDNAHAEGASSSAAPEASGASGEHTSARPAGAGAESDPPEARLAGGDSFEPVIRSAEGAVARSDSAASSSDDPSNG